MVRPPLLLSASCQLPAARWVRRTQDSHMPLWTQTRQSYNRSPQMSGVFSTAAWWLATAVWAALIFYLSTPAFGAHRSIPLLARLLALFHVSVSHTTLDVLDSSIRTLAHLTEYAILAVLLYRSFRGRNRYAWSPGLALCCVVIAALYSVTDEYHQSFTSTRGPSAFDCVLDTTGAATGMLLAYFAVRFSSRQAALIRRSRLTLNPT
jgi:VanZ family protein